MNYMNYRVQLAPNSVAKKPKSEKIIMVNDYDGLVKNASAKFRINSKKIRFFVARDLPTARRGLEITNNDELQKIITDDMMLIVTNGEEYRGKVIKGDASINFDVLQKISKPPRWPYPGCDVTDASNVSNTLNTLNIQSHSDISDVNIVKSILSQPSTESKYCNKEMNGIFPIFRGDVLDCIKKVAAKNPKITASYRDGYVSFDYDDDIVFPPINSWDDAVQRECRGLIISTASGRVLARRFHKFFNLNETSDSLVDSIDFEDACVYEKLDGSLVSPILLDNGELIWATRRNRITEVEYFIKSSSINYLSFVMNYLSKGVTPLFEWCHDRKAVGVMYYPERKLVLLALRDNETGNYLPLDNIDDINIPQVVRHPFKNIRDTCDEILPSTNREGVVISLRNGQRYKLKCSWYVYMCNAQKIGGNANFLPEFLKLRNTIKDIPSEKIWITALLHNDDTLALCTTLLPTDEAQQFRSFVNIVLKNTQLLESQLINWVKSNFATTSDRDAISSVAQASGWPSWVVDDSLDGKNLSEKLTNYLLGIAKSRKVNMLGELLDVQWNSTTGCPESMDEQLDICTFQSCDRKIKSHVLDVYMPKKLSNILGLKQVFSDTIVNIPNNYSPDEGKIIGLWEMFVNDDVWDLRIDLQPSRKTYSSHYGSPEHALFLVQYGSTNNLDTHPHGEFAGVLVPTDSDVTVGEILDAMGLSFDTLKMIKIRRRIKLTNSYKIFCDLDGVLADFEKGVKDVTGRSTTEQSSSKMWQRVLNHPKFFESLEWMPDGKKLWSDILAISRDKKPVILTGTPMSTKKQYATEKKKWCNVRLGDEIEVITCVSAEKYKYSAPGHILIDDRLDAGRLWTVYGGVFIHHITPERTIYELKRTLGLHKKIDVSCSTELTEYICDKPINVITDVWPVITDEIVSIDSEWRPDSDTKSISIVQLSTSKDVYIIDMLNSTDVIKEQLYKLLIDGKVLKICFGMSAIETTKIGSDIINVIDLQEICTDMLNIPTSNNVASLCVLTRAMLNKKLQKSKEHQTSNWDQRPLTIEQLKYAADDVTILLELYDVMKMFNTPPKHLYMPRATATKQIKNDFDPSMPVKVLFSGVFLSENSKKELLKMIHPIHPKISADYVIMDTEPSEYDLRGVPMGETTCVKITGTYSNEYLQIARCECLDRVFEIIISAAPNALNVDISFDKEWIDIAPFQLFGTIGVQVQTIIDLLATLPDRIKRKITEFKNNASTDQTLRFKPGELSAYERSVIHEYASENNMSSTSTGREDKRQLTLTMRRRVKYDEDEEKIGETKRITDAYQFSVLKIVNENQDILTFGRITKYDIEWKNASFGKKLLDEPYSTELAGQKPYSTELAGQKPKKLIILRGLQGSGKSQLCRCLEAEKPIICSADDYLMVDGEYIFDAKKLQEVHTYCYDSVENAMQMGERCIIVDNVNSRLIEYEKYKKLAIRHDYKVIVLEIHCKDRDQATNFAKQNTHNVSIKDVLKTLARWETDDDAIMLTPYEPTTIDYFGDGTIENIELNERNIICTDKTLQKWLSDMKLYHFSKMRRKTHMCMHIGNRPIAFLDIPDDLYDEFLERYAASGIHDEPRDEPKYILETINEKFKLFFDIDYVDDCELSDEQILKIVTILRSHNIIGCIYVTGCTTTDSNYKIKTGIHLKCPDMIVHTHEAVEIRSAFVKSLYDAFPEKNWESIIDQSIYSGGHKGLRMFGSRKATNGVDKGKVYKLLFAVDESGNKFTPHMTDVELLKTVSIIADFTATMD